MVGAIISRILARMYWIIRRLTWPQRVYLDRAVMNASTKGLILDRNLMHGSTLEISGDDWAKFGFSKYRSVHYPEFDICEKNDLNEKFDLIIAEQVFEHLKFPYRAGRNVYQLLRPGGHFLISVPFLQKIHDVPIDCCRWSEEGIKYFLIECGFFEGGIVAGSWGNAEAARTNLCHRFSFPFYNPFFDSLYNDRYFPLQVWALAQKH